MKKHNHLFFWFSVVSTIILFLLLIGFCFFIRSTLCNDAFVPLQEDVKTAIQPEPDDVNLIDVPYYNQSDEYPTGCEIVSAAMILHYYGYSTPIDDLIDDYLNTCEIRTTEEIAFSTATPNEAFLGNPRDTDSYGCYAPVIADMLNRVLTQHTAYALSGESFSSLCSRFLDTGTPVLIWATLEMQPAFSGTLFYLPDGSTFQWIAPEHCLVLIGYDDQSFYFNDPYYDYGVVAYPKETVFSRYYDLGMQAIVILPDA